MNYYNTDFEPDVWKEDRTPEEKAISSIGADLDYAGDIIFNLKGDYRIPYILKKADTLSRK